MHDDRNFLASLINDGRPLLKLTGLCLILSGLFAIFLSAAGQFLPHDVKYLGMTPDQLCAINECRIVHFMFHDRVSFGGAIIAIGVMYLWLVEFPLKRGEAWSWWLLLASGIVGFGSFLAYLGYGYLDTWHGIATLGLLPCFGLGLWLAHSRLLPSERTHDIGIADTRMSWSSSYGLGRAGLLLASLGLAGGGLTILGVGMTSVFVPQDLAYMGLAADELRAINPRLVPLIAHDRAGFGGGVSTCGMLMVFSVWYSAPSRSLWQALCLSGLAGFGTAIGIHPIIGYTDGLHLGPAVAGSIVFGTGLVLTWKRMTSRLSTSPPRN